MSVNVKPKNKVVQKFVRINIDSKLSVILTQLSADFPLLSNAEIIKMLISKGIRQSQSKSFGELLRDQEFLNIESESDQFEFLKNNELLK